MHIQGLVVLSPRSSEGSSKYKISYAALPSSFDHDHHLNTPSAEQIAMYQAKDPIDVQRLDASVLYEGEIGGSPVAKCVVTPQPCLSPRTLKRCC